MRGGKPVPHASCGGLVLTPLAGEFARYRHCDPDTPPWNLTASRERIPGHNGINKPIFRAFLCQLFLEEHFNRRIRSTTPLPEPHLPR